MSTGESISNFDQTKFTSLCAASAGKNPVFNVMDPYFNFNITGSMTFEGIEFNGVQAASGYSTTHFPPTNRIPVKLCKVEKEPFAYLKEQVDDNHRTDNTLLFGKTASVNNSATFRQSHVYY